MGTKYHYEAPSLWSTQNSDAPQYERSHQEHPPYSILDAAGGWWQNRRTYWTACGIKDAGQRPTIVNIGAPQASHSSGNPEAVPATSQFSPVLTELLLNYYSKPGDTILDPFCGGPIRGAVSAMMDRKYVGIDVRQEQIDINKTTYPELAHLWHHGDATDHNDIGSVMGKTGANMVLTCPPYHDLEHYSEQTNDLSNLGWYDFLQAHQEAIRIAASHLNPYGFLCWVIGDIRAPNGTLRLLPQHAATHIQNADLTIWNHHIVRQPLVTAPSRWERSWRASMKATMTHTEILVARYRT